MRKPLRSLVQAISAACLLAAGTSHAQFQERAIRATLSAQKDHPLGVALTKVQQCVAQELFVRALHCRAPFSTSGGAFRCSNGD